MEDWTCFRDLGSCLGSLDYKVPETSRGSLPKSGYTAGFSAGFHWTTLCLGFSPPVRWGRIVWMRAIGNIT